MAAGLLLTAGYRARWFVFAYRARLGWLRGPAAGLIGAAPGLLLLLALLTLAQTGTREGGPAWALAP